MMKGKVIALLALLALCVAKCQSSAIPMWEYLSKDEKVSNLREEIKVLCFIKKCQSNLKLHKIEI